MIVIDKSLFIQIVNFLFLIIVLNYLLYRPLRRMISQRKNRFQGYRSEIEDLSGRAEATIAEIESRLAEARREAFLKKDEIKEEGLAEEKGIVAEATGEAEQAVEEIKAQISEEIKVAREALRDQVHIFSKELAQKVLGRSL